MMNPLRRIGPVILLGVLIGIGGCATPDDNPEERREALNAVLEELQLRPRPSESTVRVGEVEVKSGPPQYVATGILPGDRDAALAALDAALQGGGWTVADSSSSDQFLGWTLLAARDDMVLRADVGAEGIGRQGATTYPSLDGEVYLQLSVVRRDSGVGWSDI